jgi:hypothetical protein
MSLRKILPILLFTVLIFGDGLVQEPLKGSFNLNINNNGISLFPNFSLGKPAAIVNASVGKANFYFEPEMRWGLNAKPWSYIYWLRYKHKSSEHFGLNLGVQISYVFAEKEVGINGVLKNRYLATRYAAFEVAPTYYKSKKFAFGIYYLNSFGLDSNGIQSGQFVSIQPKFLNIKVSNDYFLGFYPQLFHLILDDKKGTYFSESLSFNKKNLPVSLTSLFTYKLNSSIAGDNIVWNVGINFHFD